MCARLLHVVFELAATDRARDSRHAAHLFGFMAWGRCNILSGLREICRDKKLPEEVTSL